MELRLKKKSTFVKKNIIFDIKNYQFDNLSYRLLVKYTVISKTHGNWEQLVINEIDFLNAFLRIFQKITTFSLVDNATYSAFLMSLLGPIPLLLNASI